MDLNRRRWLQLLGLVRFMPQLPAPKPTDGWVLSGVRTNGKPNWAAMTITLNGETYELRAMEMVDGWARPVKVPTIDVAKARRYAEEGVMVISTEAMKAFTAAPQADSEVTVIIS